MFKKRTVQVSFPKKAEDSTSGEDKFLHPETVKLISERGKDVVKFVAITVVGAYAAIKTIDTLSQIAIKKTKSVDQE